MRVCVCVYVYTAYIERQDLETSQIVLQYVCT